MQTQNSHGCFGKQASDSAVLPVARLFLTPETPELGRVRRELPGVAAGTELCSGQTKPEELSRAFLAEREREKPVVAAHCNMLRYIYTMSKLFAEQLYYRFKLY